MKSKIKNNFFKIVSLICALAIITLCLVSGISVSASTVAFSDLVSDIIGLTPVGQVVDFANVIYDVYLFFFEDSVMSDRETSRLKIQAAWKVFTDNSCFTSDEFSEYWDACINELGLADDRLIMIEETIRLGFTKEEIIAYCYESDGQGISVSDQGDVNVTPSVLQNVYSDYAFRYAPAPNVDEYKWSYQSDYVNARAISMDSNGFYPFSPIAPVYTYTRGTWGNRLWSSVYVLLFLQDDNKGTYYCEHYVHIYSTRNDEGSALLNIDFYNLSDNTLYKSYSQPWDSDRPYISIDYNYSLLSYTSHSNFLGNSDFTFTFYAPSMSGLSRGTLYTGDLDNKTAYNQADGTFNPSTTPADDWGFMLSSHPFELYANQSSINWEQVPDNYVITIEGDTIYNYPITNPETGESSTINYYITNNYTLPENSTDDPADNGGPSSGGSTSGNVNVSGEVLVGGQIDIKSDPIDINVNVNTGSSSDITSSEGVQFDQDVSLNNYYDWMNEQTSGFSGFMKQFFNWLPPDILIMICAGFGLVILARFLGR